jgi:hypothetical protein
MCSAFMNHRQLPCSFVGGIICCGWRIAANS